MQTGVHYAAQQRHIILLTSTYQTIRIATNFLQIEIEVDMM